MGIRLFNCSTSGSGYVVMSIGRLSFQRRTIVLYPNTKSGVGSTTPLAFQPAVSVQLAAEPIRVRPALEVIPPLAGGRVYSFMTDLLLYVTVVYSGRAAPRWAPSCGGGNKMTLIKRNGPSRSPGNGSSIGSKSRFARKAV